MKQNLSKRILSLLLVLALLAGFAVPVGAANPPSGNLLALSFDETSDFAAAVDESLAVDPEETETIYDPEDIVRVSIVLDQASTLEKGYSTLDIVSNAEAMAYRADLEQTQADMTARIENAIGQTLNVQWNLTLAANIISADVAYGQLETIKNVPGVKTVEIEIQYEPCVVDEDLGVDPNSSTSSSMIGSSAAYALGYTGAGSRIAIIDTGLDMDHQSFADSGYKYSLSVNAAKAEMTTEEYIQSLDLLDAEEIDAVLSETNALKRTKTLTGADLFKTDKVPFTYNYIAKSATIVDHDSDAQGGHGSHVAGIAAANAYIPMADGTFSMSAATTSTQGVAPDAQIIVLKVFGPRGPYESDYMAAIEDAIILGCDAVNLSLGSSSPGFSMSTTYEELMDSLVESDTTVTMSGGNNGHWADYAAHEQPGYLYVEDVNLHTGGSPGAYTNSLTVASADNIGGTGYYLTVHGENVFYTESDFSNEPMRTIAGTHEYIFLDSVGTQEDFAAVADVLEGKIALCSRGSTSFFQKANLAVEYGAAAVIIYNNQAGSINMDLTDYSYTAPVVSITQAEGDMIRAGSTAVTDENGNVCYYTGTMEIMGGVGTVMFNPEFNTISSFSSYGVTGALELKPEITAPGGMIYSVDGEIAGGTSYVTMSGTSMAAPQVAGMAAIVGQYIRENNLVEKTGLSQRKLTISLLMSTAVAMEESEGRYYPVFRQGAGLANVGEAIDAGSYVFMGRDATDSWADGKIKAELKDDPQRTGLYEFTFSLNNLTDNEQKYMLSADLFTQDTFTEGEYTYMDTQTTALLAGVTWTVDGVVLEPAQDLDRHEVNGDGLVNADDVQAIVDYVVGTITKIDTAAADVDGNGEITTYDAYELLSKLSSGLMTLPAGGETKVKVSIQLTDDQKAQLDETFVNGAYIQGYIFAKQLGTADGDMGTTHSIPMLAFYGNWMDARMFDYGTYGERVDGIPERAPYVTTASNYMTLQYDNGTLTTYLYAGNPYHLGAEGKDVSDRWAVKLSTGLYQVNSSLIRSAGAQMVTITNQDGNLLYHTETSTGVPAYYYPAAGAWQYAPTIVSMRQKVGAIGGREDDVLTVSRVAIPELYAGGISMSAEDMLEMVEAGEIPETSFQRFSFTVDNTAPEVFGLQKDMLTGDLVVSARDNNYIASIQVQSMGGSVFAYAVPEQSEKKQDCTVTLDLSEVKDMIGPECLVVVCDYAMNERAYVVEYGGEPMDPTGRMFGFTDSKYRGGGQRWMTIDPDTVWYNNKATDSAGFGGTKNLMFSDINVTAAEYVGGYVYMAAVDGYFYVAKQGDWNNVIRASRYTAQTTKIEDMAFNYADNTLYALGGDSKIYTVDLSTTAMTAAIQVTLTLPYKTSSTDIIQQTNRPTNLAIDDAGTFYLTNVGRSYSRCYLWKFTEEDIEDTPSGGGGGGGLPIRPPLGTGVETNARETMGYINDLACVSGVAADYIGKNVPTSGGNTKFGSMAWDHDKDVLYLTCSNTEAPDYSSFLLEVDTQTGLGKQTNELTGGYDRGCCSRLQAVVTGLYIVPASVSYTVEPVTEALSITLDKEDGRAMANSEFQLEALLTPWNLTDRTVTWTSSDETIATVEDGLVKLLMPGVVTITATSNATPEKSASCTLTVEEVPDVTLTGLITDASGNNYWSEFNTRNPREITYLAKEDKDYFAGTLAGDMLMVHDNARYYTIDPDTFELLEKNGGLGNMFRYSDSAFAPAVEGSDGQTRFGNLVVGPAYSGKYFVIHSYDAGKVAYVSMSSALSNDPMAVVAHYRTSGNTQSFLVLTEGGALWQFNVTQSVPGSNSISYVKIGDVGLKLPGVSQVAGGIYATMHYDQESGYLLLAASLGTGTTDLYAIDPDSLIYSKIGDLGRNVFPVIAMYEYERDTELTVKLTARSTILFTNETLQMKADVLPLGSDNTVTWSTSDESIATVDANGLVTPVKAGVVDIIATTVATNEEGNQVSASYTVKVKDLTTLDGQVKAQIWDDEEKADWVTIDLDDLNITTDAEDTYGLFGGGVYEGKIYGTDITYSGMGGNAYMVDPANGYKEHQGIAMSDIYGMLDATAIPAMTVDRGDGEEITVFGHMAYLDTLGDFKMLEDYTTATGYSLVSGWPLGNWWFNLAAVAYAGEGTYGGEPTRIIYVLGADGNLYKFETWFGDYDEELGIGYGYSRSELGLIGKDFGTQNKRRQTMTYVKTDTMEGLVIGYNGDENVELYYVDLTEDVLSCGFLGELPNTSVISVMHTDWELNGAVTENTNTTDEVLPEGALEVCHESAIFSTMEEETEENTVPAGGLNAVTVETVAPAATDTEDDCKTGTITMELTADNETTNGLITVEYDTAKLTLTGKASGADFSAFQVDSGRITFAYVNGTAMAKGAVLATLTFVAVADSQVAVTVREENNAKPGTTQIVDVRFAHANTQIRDALEAGCTTAGYTGDTYCADCGKLLAKGEIIEATGHAYGEWIVTKPATCTEIGEETRYCDNCGIRETRTVDATGHSFGEWTVTKAATCTEDGIETRKCACGETETRAIPATGHSFGQWTVTTEPTCTADGVETRKCVCGETETRAIAALGHELTAVTVEATCTEEGYTEYTCSVCGYSYRDNVVEAIGHDYEATVTAPTCTEAGYTTYTCAVCGDNYVADEVEALGHDWSDWAVTVGAACFTDGEEVRTCTTCGETETRVIARNADNCPSKAFTDLNADQWYHQAVDYVLRNGLMNGVGEGKFAPNGTLTRAQLVTVLYRLEGEPSVEGLVNPFTDVPADTWYTDAIIWAADAGVVIGKSTAIFDPNGAITREQIATILYRYAGAEEVAEDYLASFADVDKVSAYAADAMNWAVATGLINGTTETTLAPTATATRAQIATIFMRYGQLGN